MAQQLKKSLLLFMITIVNALKITFKTPRLKWVLLGSFYMLFILHLTILPAHILGMDIGLSSFSNLNTEIIFFSFLLSLLESILISMLFFLIINKKHCKTSSAAGGMFIGLISPLLCCSPILPTLLGAIAVIFPSAMLGVGIKLQYFINVYQTQIFIFALSLLLLAIFQNAKYITNQYIEVT